MLAAVPLHVAETLEVVLVSERVVPLVMAILSAKPESTLAAPFIRYLWQVAQLHGRDAVTLKEAVALALTALGTVTMLNRGRTDSLPR